MTTARTTVSKKTSTSKTGSDKPAPKSRTNSTPKTATVRSKTPAAADTATAAATPKPRAPRKPANSKAAAAEITPEQRYQLIAMAAYYRAERRGFARGGELNDWVAAEQEIDDMLKS